MAQIDFVWATDTHLDCLENDEAVSVWARESLGSLPGEAVLLTGDISISNSVLKHVHLIREQCGKPVYLTFGNHDFWEGSIQKLRAEARSDVLKRQGIVWMGAVDYVPFGKEVALVGHDGWYDALNGDAKNSRFIMKDWFKISEFANLADLLTTCRTLAAEGVSHIETSCEKAIIDGRKKILILTHFPPFVEVCFYRGGRSEDHALPWYSSKLMGEALVTLSQKYPHVNFIVLCGHTHSFADVTIRPNLRVVVGNSDYGLPSCTKIGIKE